MNDWVAIALLVILLAGNAFFVAGEFAIMSTRRAQIEPLVEEIVGEVSDEHDRGRTERPLRYGNGDWVFSGLRRPDEINALIPGLEVEESPEYETVGGFMMERLGRIPEVGDSVPVPGGTLRVDTLEGRRVDRIRFTPAPSAQEQTEKGGNA